MNSSGVKLCVFLFLAVEGAHGPELTINVRKNASVTLACTSREDLMMCYCPYSQNCTKCTNADKLTAPRDSIITIYKSPPDTYFRLSGLEYSDSGLYVCYRSFGQLGKMYSINVLEDQNPTVMIATVGQSIVISCGSGLDIPAASEKHWCRSANADFCQPDTITDAEKETRGDFQVLEDTKSFSLEKHQLTHNDTGFYRLTLTFQNEIKVCVIELQVKDEANFLQITPVRVQPKPGEPLKITCQYSHDLQTFSKSWLCDNLECPETVKVIDDTFSSALVLMIDHVVCSKIRFFQCVANMPGSSKHSSIYKRPLYQVPIVNADVVLGYNKEVRVFPYNLLNLICQKPTNNWKLDKNYLPIGKTSRNEETFYHYYYSQTRWCRLSRGQCWQVKENVKQSAQSLTLQICVTPNDNGTRYYCSDWGSTSEVKIAVIAPTQPVTPAVLTPIIPRSRGMQHNIGIITAVACIILVIIVCLIVIRWKGQRLRQSYFGLFTRRVPLSAVDMYANTYANSVAQYYSRHRRQVPDKHAEKQGADEENSSNSDDEFEELPVCPKTSSGVVPVETDYIIVKPGRMAHIDPLRRDGEECEHAAQSSSGRGNNEEDDDDEDEVTYIDVIIKPKH